LYTTNSLAASPNSGNGAPNWVGTLNAFTITAWINIGQAGSRTAGTLGSAIFHCSDNSANQPNGIEITYKTVECGAQYNGNLACVINDDADWDTGSTGTYPLMSTVSIGNPDILSGVVTNGCDPTNWVFFAITWDGPNTNLTYYFGSGLDAATQDVARVSFNRFGIAQTNIPNTGQGTVGGYNLSGGSSRTGNSGATRGCIDEFNMFNRVLTLAEIRNVQIGGTVPPLLGVSSAPPNATVAWGPKTTPQMEFQLQSRTNLSAGAWGDVTNAPTDSGNTRSLALGETNAARFFRLRNK
jgi:hypothetical protein